MSLVWQVKTIKVQAGVHEDLENLTNYLNDGWEPFSAGPSPVGHIFYLRRRTEYVQ